eukprot:364431-Chlamydomonas_euryale.AAC.6
MASRAPSSPRFATMSGQSTRRVAAGRVWHAVLTSVGMAKLVSRRALCHPLATSTSPPCWRVAPQRGTGHGREVAAVMQRHAWCRAVAIQMVQVTARVEGPLGGRWQLPCRATPGA